MSRRGGGGQVNQYKNNVCHKLWGNTVHAKARKTQYGTHGPVSACPRAFWTALAAPYLSSQFDQRPASLSPHTWRSIAWKSYQNLSQQSTWGLPDYRRAGRLINPTVVWHFSRSVKNDVVMSSFFEGEFNYCFSKLTFKENSADVSSSRHSFLNSRSRSLCDREKGYVS